MPALSDFTIRLASSSQIQQYLREAFDVWGGGKSWEFNETFERCMGNGDWTKDGGVCGWVLVKRNDPDGEIYSGTRVYRRKALLKEPQTDHVKDVFSYNITAVLTPKRHLRNGYATHLLRLLHYRLADPILLPPFPETWGMPPPALSPDVQATVPHAIASVLWSAVGSTFYEKVTIGTQLPGWIVKDEDSLQITWNLRPPSQPSIRTWNWLYTSDLSAIGERLSRAARAKLETDHCSASKPVWIVDPASPGVLSYIPSRALRPRSDDWKTVYETEPCGVRIPAISPDTDEAIVLFANSTQALSGILVTYVHNLHPNQLVTLLDALDDAGALAQRDQGLVWGIGRDTALGKAWLAQGDRKPTIARRGDTENLLGVAWYGKPEERGDMIDTQMWTLA